MVNLINDSVFRKIRENLIKNTERRSALGGTSSVANMTGSTPSPKPLNPLSIQDIQKETKVLNTAGIEIVDRKNMMTEEKLELESAAKLKKDIQPILAEKLGGFMQSKPVETKHSLGNQAGTVTLNVGAVNIVKNSAPKVDPYREVPQ